MAFYEIYEIHEMIHEIYEIHEIHEMIHEILTCYRSDRSLLFEKFALVRE